MQRSDILAMCCTSDIIFCDICCFRSASYKALQTVKLFFFYIFYRKQNKNNLKRERVRCFAPSFSLPIP